MIVIRAPAMTSTPTTPAAMNTGTWRLLMRRLSSPFGWNVSCGASLAQDAMSAKPTSSEPRRTTLDLIVRNTRSRFLQVPSRGHRALLRRGRSLVLLEVSLADSRADDAAGQHRERPDEQQRGDHRPADVGAVRDEEERPRG